MISTTRFGGKGAAWSLYLHQQIKPASSRFLSSSPSLLFSSSPSLLQSELAKLRKKTGYSLSICKKVWLKYSWVNRLQSIRMFRISGIRFFPISGTWRNWQRWSRCREVARGAGSGLFTVKYFHWFWKNSTVHYQRLPLFSLIRLFLKTPSDSWLAGLGIGKGIKIARAQYVTGKASKQRHEA